jgi:hypothetical protein
LVIKTLNRIYGIWIRPRFSKKHGSSDTINLDPKSGQRLYLGPVGIDILLEEKSRQLA